MDSIILNEALNELKTKYRQTSQEEPIEKYKNRLQEIIGIEEQISAEDAFNIIHAYPIKNNWKIFIFLAEELKCLQKKETFSCALRYSYQRCPMSRDLAYSYFGHSLAFSDCLMYEEEISFFNDIPNEMELFRGANIDECKCMQYNVSWTNDFETAIYFAFFAYIKKDFDLNSRGVLMAKVKKSNIKAYFGESVNHGKEYEYIVLFDEESVPKVKLTWNDFCQPGKYEKEKHNIQQKFPTKYDCVMRYYNPMYNQ